MIIRSWSYSINLYERVPGMQVSEHLASLVLYFRQFKYNLTLSEDDNVEFILNCHNEKRMLT